MINIEPTKLVQSKTKQITAGIKRKSDRIKALKAVKYEGYRLKGMKHGKGTLRVDNEEFYSGEFAFDKKEGYGTWTTQKEIYLGFWKDDNKHGTGKLNYADGTSYKGHFQEGLRHGFGMFTKDNMYFMGFWNRDRKQGDFVCFCLDTGEALEILYQNDNVVSVKKLNNLDECNQSDGDQFEQNSRNSQLSLEHSEIKEVFCVKILELENLIRPPALDLLQKRSRPHSIQLSLDQEESISGNFNLGFYFINLL